MTKLFSILALTGFVFVSQTAFAEDIQATISPVKSAVGNILYALYNSAESFSSSSGEYQSGTVAAIEGSQLITLSGVSPGMYAMTVFQDLNGNGKLDTGLFGKPTEPFAISNITRTLWSQPKWEEVSFEVKTGVVTDISLLMKLQ